MTQKLILSFEELKEMSYSLAETIKKDNINFDMIVTLTKWWLVPTYFVADILWIKTIETLNINSYNLDWKQAEIIDKTYFKKSFSNLNILIVDDLVDSWNSISYVLENYEISNYKLATIFYKEKSKIIPDYFCKKANDEWIVFPYES